MSHSAILEAFEAHFAGPPVFRRLVSRVVGVERFSDFHEALAGGAQGFADLVLRHLGVTISFEDFDLRNMPAKGPVIVTANHPLGMLDGLVMASLVQRIRPDVKLLGNRVLSAIPQLSDLLIPVDTEASCNAAAFRESLRFLQSGGCLILFPAGEVAHFRAAHAGVSESRWQTGVSRMVDGLARRGVSVPVVPAWIAGSNSLLFQVAGLGSARFRTALLLREFLNKRDRRLEIRLGSAVAADQLLAMETPEARTEYLRWRTEILANRYRPKARTAWPLRRKGTAAQAAIEAPVAASELEAEIAQLGAEALLCVSGGLHVYAAQAKAIPTALREIGRLREVTFRAAGEGTGKGCDLDRFDAEYLHLFAWHPARREIVGAYRLAASDRVSELYTATLFRYDDAFLRKAGPAVELGRSFVRQEYQRSFAALLALWNGIGAWIAANPRYRVLFGPVSISAAYQSLSKEMMVAFLERSAWLGELAGRVRARKPFRRSAARIPLPERAFDIDDLSKVISDIDPGKGGVPVLLRQYLRLGGMLLGFNVDQEFSGVLDGLILVDLTRAEPRLIERYFGKEAAGYLFKCWEAPANRAA